jgi:hypothetical protein
MTAKRSGRPRKGQHVIADYVARVMRAAAAVIADQKNGKIKRDDALPLVARYSALVGFVLCTVKDRRELLRRVADCLEGKAPSTANDYKDIDQAIKRAEDELVGMFVRKEAKFAEIWEQYEGNRTRESLRRVLKKHGYLVHPDKRGAPHGRRKKRAAR